MEELSIKTEFGKSYLVIHNAVKKENVYLLNMLLHNKLKGFLSCREYPIENKTQLYYEITNMKSLEKEYENRNMTFDEIHHLFKRINEILEYSSSYLLEQNYFVLEPEYMFLDLETEEMRLLYLPQDTEKVFNQSDRKAIQGRYYKLADFLLEKVNHKEEHAVNIAYQFYKMSKEDYFSITSFINYIEKESIIKESEKREIKESPQMSTVEEKENNEEKEKSGFLKQWLVVIGTGILSVILCILYFIIQNKSAYDFYFVLASILFTVLTLLKIILNIINYVLHKKEDNYKMPIEPVSVEEYWSDSDETVFFDENKEEILTDLMLEWKDKNIGKKYIMNQFPFIIGKMEGEADCIVNEASISRLHAKVFKKDNSIYIQDLNSTNGTSVNGVPLLAGEEFMVKRGDELQLGKQAFFVV